jgi:hypothetical protein
MLIIYILSNLTLQFDDDIKNIKSFKTWVWDFFHILEKNDLFWTLDAGIYLDTKGNRDIIKEEILHENFKVYKVYN